jgi:hypothetical protein
VTIDLRYLGIEELKAFHLNCEVPTAVLLLPEKLIRESSPKLTQLVTGFSDLGFEVVAASEVPENSRIVRIVRDKHFVDWPVQTEPLQVQTGVLWAASQLKGIRLDETTERQWRRAASQGLADSWIESFGDRLICQYRGPASSSEIPDGSLSVAILQNPSELRMMLLAEEMTFGDHFLSFATTAIPKVDVARDVESNSYQLEITGKAGKASFTCGNETLNQLDEAFIGFFELFCTPSALPDFAEEAKVTCYSNPYWSPDLLWLLTTPVRNSLMKSLHARRRTRSGARLLFLSAVVLLGAFGSVFYDSQNPKKEQVTVRNDDYTTYVTGQSTFTFEDTVYVTSPLSVALAVLFVSAFVWGTISLTWAQSSLNRVRRSLRNDSYREYVNWRDSLYDDDPELYNQILTWEQRDQALRLQRQQAEISAVQLWEMTRIRNEINRKNGPPH